MSINSVSILSSEALPFQTTEPDEEKSGVKKMLISKG